jgi:hypothetical protein
MNVKTLGNVEIEHFTFRHDATRGMNLILKTRLLRDTHSEGKVSPISHFAEKDIRFPWILSGDLMVHFALQPCAREVHFRVPVNAFSGGPEKPPGHSLERNIDDEREKESQEFGKQRDRSDKN